MAKIENTTVYPLTIPTADDFLVGTDTSNENRTVSFRISDITAAGGIQGLQSVLDTGNTATQSINLTGNITVVGTVYPTTITAAGTAGLAGQILSSTGTGLQWINVAGAQDLQSVLTAGNTTTLDIDTSGNINSTGSITMNGAAQLLTLTNGVDMTLGSGSSITTSGTINLSGATSVLNFGATAVINDATGATGAAGQILTVNGAGTGVQWSTGVPVASMPTLQEVLTAGNTATAVAINFTGAATATFAATYAINSAAKNTWSGNNSFSAVGITSSTAAIDLSGSLWDGASTGTASQVLTSTATGVAWADVSTVGVASVNAATPIPAANPLTPITITPTTGAVLVRQNIYNGASFIGCVPDGGTASTFLRGDGTWVTPTGNVSTVSVGGAVASTGAAITIAPVTGPVIVTPNSYAGTTNVGHVPTGGSASTYLRGDGTWSTPATGAPEWVNRVLVQNTKWTLSNTGNYYINPDYAGNSQSMMSNDHGANSPATTLIADVDIPNNIIQANTTTSACATPYPNHKICEVEYSFIASVASTISLDLWNTDIGGGAVSNATPAATVVITAGAGTLHNGTFTLDPGGVQNILLPGKGVALTLRSNTAMANNQFALNMFFKYQAVT